MTLGTVSVFLILKVNLGVSLDFSLSFFLLFSVFLLVQWLNVIIIFNLLFL